MQCERAQEYFSDYIERTLEEPRVAAIETHLSACSGCREELGQLRHAFAVLDAVPEVTVPADGVERVIQRLRELTPDPRVQTSLGPVEALMHFLRRLNPAGMAMGAAMATLIIAGSVMLPPVQGLIRAGLAPSPEAVAKPELGTTSASQAPQLSLDFGAASPAGQPVTLRLLPSMALPGAEIRVGGSGQPFTWQGDLGPDRPAELLMTLAPGRSAETISLVVSSAAARAQFRYLVVVPMAAPTTADVTLFMESQPLEQALASIAPVLGKPIIVVNPTGERVSFSAENRPVRQALRDLADQLRVTITDETTVTRLTPAQ